jgi:hypothetical protein
MVSVMSSMQISIPSCLPPVLANISTGIEAITLLVVRAESTYAQGDLSGAQEIYDDAERRLTTMLRQICGLTDSEADDIEPVFSEVEIRLSRLRSFFSV